MAGEGVISGVMAAVLCGTALLSLPSAVVPRVFGFVPAHTFSVRSYPWNLVTYVVVEPNVLLAVCSAVYLLTFGVAVESIIGARALIKLIAVSTLSTSLTLLILSALLFNIGFTWFFQCYCGLWPVASAILVPWVAASPRSSAFPSKLPRGVQRQHMPITLLTIALVIDWVFRGRQHVTGDDVGGSKVFLASVFLPSLFGLLAACCLQSILNTPSEVPLSVLFEPLFTLHKTLRKSKPPQDGGDERTGVRGEDLAGTVAVPMLRGAAAVALLPGSTEEEAQRRRNIALTALNSRLQQTVTPSTAAPVEPEDSAAV